MKVTHIFMADLFGYERQTFLKWKNKGTPELLARYNMLKFGAIMIKNNIKASELFKAFDENKELREKIIELEKGINEHCDKIEQLRGIGFEKKSKAKSA